jgi:putative transposase
MGMRCVECGSVAVTERSDLTAHGYRRFRCRTCGKQFNERSGTVLNRAQYPSDVIALVVFWRLRYKLSLRDLPEMFALRGMVFSHEAVRDWEAKLTPVLADALRRRRRGKVGHSWYVDETYLKVGGHWRYLYRAIDRSGALVDVMFSETRDMAAAKAFFRSKAVTGIIPERVTTDGHDSYPRAIRSELGKNVRHRTSRYLKNRLEQRSPGHQRPLPTDARLQMSPFGGPVLSRLRRTPQPPPPPFLFQTNTFPPAAADCSSSVRPQPCSAFCKPRDHTRLHPDAGYICWREL